MISCLLCDNEKFNTVKVKNLTEDNIYRKCNYKTDVDFNKIVTLEYNKNLLEVWGKTKGKLELNKNIFLKNNKLTDGKIRSDTERYIEKTIKSKKIFLTQSCTNALEACISICGLKKNDEIFSKCYDLLGLGKFMLMFSEGGHHNEYYLQNLSKGSSRLAFKAAQQNPGKKIYLQPVGINYGHHQQPQCTLHLVYGQPIEVSDFIDLKLNDVENISILKLELQNRMKACLWLPENTENYFIQKKKINKHTTQVDFKTLKTALKNNHTKMPEVKPKSKTRKVLIFLLSIPNIIPLWISRKIIQKLEDIVFVSSLKYVLGVFLFPIWWLTTSIAIAYLYENRVMTTYLLVCTLSLFIRQRISLS